MLSFDLLYPTEEKRQAARNQVRLSPGLIHDLQLEELAQKGFLTDAEYGQLCEELQYLPDDREVILFRQTILQDLIQNSAFLKNCMELCRQLSDDLPRKGFNRGYNIWAQSQMPIYKHLDTYIGLLQSNCQVLCDARLTPDVPFQSETLKRMTDFLKNTDYQERLQEIIDLLSKLLDSNSIGYEAEYGYGNALHSIIVRSISPQNIYAVKERGFLKKKVIDEERRISFGENYILKNNVWELYSRTLVRLCDFASRLNSALVKPFKEIQNALVFYQAGIKLYQMYQTMNVPFCMPEILQDKYDAPSSLTGRLEFRQLYSLRLLTRAYQQGDWFRAKNIQANDYSNQEGRIAIITGFNSGGKTTFLQALGSAQLLAQAGFHVPAASFRVYPAPFIGSLFANAEDIFTVHGKLEQELVQVRELAERLLPGSLLLMNEILATTSEGEASDIMREILHAFSKYQPHIVFVTHLGRLADYVEKGELPLEEGEQALNYVTKQIPGPEGQLQKTFRICRGTPEKGAFEREVLNTYAHYID